MTAMRERGIQPRPQGAFPWLFPPRPQSQGKAPWGRGCVESACIASQKEFNFRLRHFDFRLRNEMSTQLIVHNCGLHSNSLTGLRAYERVKKENYLRAGWRIKFVFCPRVPVRKGIAIVFPLCRIHWLCVAFCLVFCISSCAPAHEDRTQI